MIYPIVSYGDPALRKKSVLIEEDTDVKSLAADMLATMDQANGVGLAAPQIGKNVRLFVVDFSAHLRDNDRSEDGRKVIINPVLHIDETVPATAFEEGCLSIPGVHAIVARHEKIDITYFDENWNQHQETWTGFPARVIMHEYDHLEGRLHIDYASPLRKNMMKRRLKQISQGKITAQYKMKFPK